MPTLETVKLTKTQRNNLAKFNDPSTVEIGESEIAGLRKAYNAVALADCIRRDNSGTPALREYVRQVDDIIEKRRKINRNLRVTAKQSAKGLAWLKNLQTSPTGKKRKNAPLNHWQETAVTTFDHFEFEGFDEDSNGYRCFYAPIYKVCGEIASFSYTPRPWQSGGVPFTVL